MIGSNEVANGLGTPPEVKAAMTADLSSLGPRIVELNEAALDVDVSDWLTRVTGTTLPGDQAGEVGVTTSMSASPRETDEPDAGTVTLTTAICGWGVRDEKSGCEDEDDALVKVNNNV